MRATVGQQISVAGARTVTGRIVAMAGAPLSIADELVTHVFPSPGALAALDPATLPMPRSRGRTIVELAARAADGRLVLDAGADRDDVAAALLAVPGIGPWTAGYVRDARARRSRRVPADRPRRPRRTGPARHRRRPGRALAPWRSYALHHLWAVAAGPPTARRQRPRRTTP